MKVDTGAISSSVLPKIKTAQQNLATAAAGARGFTIPSDFAEAGKIRGIASKIEALKSQAGSLTTVVNQKIEKINAAEARNENLINSLGTFFGNVKDGAISVAADVGNTVIAAGKGILQFGESIVDTAVIVNSMIETPEAVIADGVSYLIGKEKAEKIFNSKAFNIAKATAALVTPGGSQLYFASKSIRNITNKKAENKSYTSDKQTENKSFTSNLWGNTMEFVAEDYVGGATKQFYKNTSAGKYLDEHAHGAFKSDGTVSNVVSGIGYVGGIVATTIATGGVGAAAGVSQAAMGATVTGVSAFGKYTAQSWEGQRDSSMEGIRRMHQNGEIDDYTYNVYVSIKGLTNEQWYSVERDYRNGIITYEQYKSMYDIRNIPDDWKNGRNAILGMANGAANAGWEALQFYTGAKLAGVNIVSGSAKANAAIRIGIDTAFNALDTPYRTTMGAIIDNKSFAQSWEQQGGWKSVLTNTAIGLIGSSAGEIAGLHNINKSTQILNNEQLFEGIDDITAKQVKSTLTNEISEGKINLAKMSEEQIRDLVTTRSKILTGDISSVGGRYIEVNMKKVGESLSQINNKEANDFLHYIGKENINSKYGIVYDTLINVYNVAPQDVQKYINAFVNNSNNIEQMAEQLYTKTKTAYNRQEFRNIQFDMLRQLQEQSVDSVEAGKYVARVLEKVIDMRGGYVEVGQIDGIRINAIKDIDWNQTAVSWEQLTRDIQSLPPKLKELLHEVNISDLNCTNDAFWAAERKAPGFISSATGGGGVINIFTEGSRGTLLHELGHSLDDAYGILTVHKDEWVGCTIGDIVVNKGKYALGVSEYATDTINNASTYVEDFADSVKMYYENINKLKTYYPNRYAFLEKYLGGE